MSQKLTECLFCDGQGQVEEFQYREIVHYECHECDGRGTMTVSQYNIVYRAQQELNRAILDADVSW